MSAPCCLSVRELILGAAALFGGAALVAVQQHGSPLAALASAYPAPALPVVEYHAAVLPAIAGGAGGVMAHPGGAAAAVAPAALAPAQPDSGGAAAAASPAAFAPEHSDKFARLFSALPPSALVRAAPDAEAGLDLSGCAFVSMASADESAKLALVMFQSLRDAGTRAKLLLLLMRGGFGSRHCGDAAWMVAHGRAGAGCGAADAGAAEIVSEEVLERLTALGVDMQVTDPIPTTKYTEGIAGGKSWFWGMAFNKLRVFSLTQFRKIVWLDSDDFFLRNVDHLFALPHMSGSVVTACCNFNGPAYPGGGIWVVEPSKELFAKLMDVIAKPRPGTTDGSWLIGDMQVIRAIFGAPPPEGAAEPLYPAVNDGRHGYVSGLRHFAPHRDKSPAEFDAWIDAVLDGSKPRVEGYDERLAVPGETHWRMLDMRYDQCVGSFKCSPERDDPDVVFSVHFSCLQGIAKPSQFASEEALMQAVTTTDDHSRYWFLRWYATLTRATRGAGLPAPKYTGPPVPGFNATHTDIQRIAQLTQSHLL